ncbi:MAG: M67 family metallopeptidase [Asgard group archaeon]|nr:M67 family metallopeptidase [Asgard group archaeon]
MENIKRIIIPQHLFSQLITHAEATKPNEAVALIAGKTEDEIAFAEVVFTPENVDNSTATFTVDPLVLLKIYTEVERQDKQIIAIFHTHPAPPRPSSTDLSYMEVNPYIWLISSTTNPEQTKGYYLLSDRTLKEVDVKIVRIEKTKKD